jgi:opacity protein-like surface antigen
MIRASVLQQAKREHSFLLTHGDSFMKSGIAAAVLLALSAGTAYAQSPENDEGLYLGIGYGAFNVQVDDIDDTDEAITEIDDDDNAWKVFAGWRLNPYFAFELNYVDFGNPSDQITTGGTSGDYEIGLSGFQPAVYGTVPLGPVELFGKIGYYFYDVDLTIDIDDLTDDVVESDTSEEALSYGGGIGVTILERLHAKLEYELIDTDVIDDMDSIWLTAAWRF